MHGTRRVVHSYTAMPSAVPSAQRCPPQTTAPPFVRPSRYWLARRDLQSTVGERSHGRPATVGDHTGLTGQGQPCPCEARLPPHLPPTRSPRAQAAALRASSCALRASGRSCGALDAAGVTVGVNGRLAGKQDLPQGALGDRAGGAHVVRRLQRQLAHSRR